MGQNEKLNDKSELNLKPTATEAVIGRLKEAVRVKTDGQLANYLGISRQNIGASRKRGDVPSVWIYKVAELTGYSMDWLRFGRGSRIRVEYNMDGSHHGGQMASEQAPYALAVDREPGSADEVKHAEERSGFGATVEMLAKIYSSGDPVLIRTINANIRAFCEAIDRQQRERRSTKELENLKKRLGTIEKQLRRAGTTDEKTPHK
jgi:hypothetical protein